MPINERSCKHIREYLGDEYENERVGKSLSAPAKPKTKQVPKLLLAHKWELTTNPTGWWLSEKLDGVRAYWDGSKFISRLGNEFTCPSYFKVRFYYFIVIF
jgi:DNA ligase-1